MTLDNSDRVVSARTWIAIQDMLLKGAPVTGAIAVVAVIAGQTHLADVAIVLSVSMVAISWGLETFRMNGMPYEKTISEWRTKSTRD